MEYTILLDEATEKRIEISVPAAEIDPFIETEVQRLRKNVSLKGFRKGCVPVSLLRTKYKKDIRAEALNGLLMERYRQLLNERGWKPAGQAELLNVDDGPVIKFTLRIDVIPDFEVKDYRGIEVFKEKMIPIDYLLDQTMEQIRADHGTVREIPGPAAVDDFVTVDLEIRTDDAAPERQADITIKVGDRSFPDEVNRVLVGARRGDVKEAAHEGTAYRLTIKKIEERVLPDLNDEFARTLNFETAEAFRSRVRQEVEEREQQRQEDEVREALAKIVLERIVFSVPQVLVNDEYQEMLKKNNLVDSETNKERLWPIAEQRVRFNLILDKIIEQEQIKTEDAELEKTIGRPVVNVNEKDRAVVKYLREFINRKKAMDLLYSSAVILEKSRIISPEEAKHADRPIRH